LGQIFPVTPSARAPAPGRKQGPGPRVLRLGVPDGAVAAPKHPLDPLGAEELLVVLPQRKMPARSNNIGQLRDDALPILTKVRFEQTESLL